MRPIYTQIQIEHRNMKVLVLGATGPSGILTCQYALQAGHQLVVYARNPAKLPSGNISRPGLLVACRADKVSHRCGKA
jgi:uncharacterized protein YbjT (DUF2867 family)